MPKIACIQITSNAEMLENIAKIEAMASQAVAQGAEIIFTPENVFFMEKEKNSQKIYRQSEHPAIFAAAEMARKNKVWLLVGSVAVADEGAQGADAQKAYNRSLLFNPSGEITAYYDKIHLFDVDVGDGQIYRESAKIKAGKKTVMAKTAICNLGLTICYDLRFPQLFRKIAKLGANIISVPAAFTQKTGEAHWHVLLRARAIETGCFIVAPAQTGTHASGRQTYGHSLIIDPWGRILADGGASEGIIYAEIDLAEVDKIHKQMPSLQHDRELNSL
jgi:predicted amidohydrolase